jgi:hypothetical protein
MQRPTTYGEWVNRLAAGEPFQMRDSNDRTTYKLVKLVPPGAYALYLNGSCTPVPKLMVFLLPNRLLRVEHTGKHTCSTMELFFVELEFCAHEAVHSAHR